MAEKKKGIGDALIGLFVTREGEPDEASPPPAEPAAAATGDPTVDDLIARYAGGKNPPKPSPQNAAPKATMAVPPPPPAAAMAAAPAAETVPEAPVPEVALDVEALLRKSGLSAEEQGRVDKALTLLHNLPAETPIEVKRQIVAASLHAFGIPVDQILESALLHIGAFDRHVRAGEVETQALIEESNRRLAELEQEAARIKQVVQTTRQEQQGLAFSCSRQKMRIKEVLDFFGPEAVERVKQSSVKLRDRQDT